MRFLFNVFIFCTLICISSFQVRSNSNPNYPIELRIENLRNTKGQILVALFDSESGFPDQADQAFKSWKFVPGKPIVLPSVPKGTYALSVVHDEDMNDQMTYLNKMKIPKEGYWFSNIKGPIFKKPIFEKAKFEHPLGKDATVFSFVFKY